MMFDRDIEISRVSLFGPEGVVPLPPCFGFPSASPSLLTFPRSLMLIAFHAYMNGTAIRFAKKSPSQLPCCLFFFWKEALKEKRGPQVIMHHALDVFLRVFIDVNTIWYETGSLFVSLFQIYIDMSPAQGRPLCGECHLAGAHCFIPLFSQVYVLHTRCQRLLFTVANDLFPKCLSRKERRKNGEDKTSVRVGIKSVNGRNIFLSFTFFLLRKNSYDQYYKFRSCTQAGYTFSRGSNRR